MFPEIWGVPPTGQWRIGECSPDGNRIGSVNGIRPSLGRCSQESTRRIDRRERATAYRRDVRPSRGWPVDWHGAGISGVRQDPLARSDRSKVGDVDGAAMDLRYDVAAICEPQAVDRRNSAGPKEHILDADRQPVTHVSVKPGVDFIL